MKTTQNFQLMKLLSKDLCVIIEERKATTVGLCVKKEEKATHTVSRKVWRKRKKKIVRFATN